MSVRYVGGAFITLMLLVIPATFHKAAAQQTIAPEADGERQRIEEIVREYLLNDPDLLVEMMQRLDAREQAAQASVLKESLAEYRDQLVDASAASVLGNPDGKTVIVEFSDYNCPYCRRMAPTVRVAIGSNPDLKVVLREFPVLGQARTTPPLPHWLPRGKADTRTSTIGSSPIRDGSTRLPWIASLPKWASIWKS